MTAAAKPPKAQSPSNVTARADAGSRRVAKRLSGRRRKNAAMADTASAPPAGEKATNRPNEIGSRASDQEPCSLGRNTLGDLVVEKTAMAEALMPPS